MSDIKLVINKDMIMGFDKFDKEVEELKIAPFYAVRECFYRSIEHKQKNNLVLSDTEMNTIWSFMIQKDRMNTGDFNIASLEYLLNIIAEEASTLEEYYNLEAKEYQKIISGAYNDKHTVEGINRIMEESEYAMYSQKDKYYVLVCAYEQIEYMLEQIKSGEYIPF